MKTNPETLHIHMPVYNTAQYVGDAVDAVLDDMEVSGVSDYRLMITDDASTDGTAEVLEAYAGHPNISVVTNPANLGIGLTHRNQMQASMHDGHAPFAVSFRDSDDISIAGSSKKLLDTLEDGAGLASGLIREFSVDPDEFTERTRPNEPEVIIRGLMRGHIPAWNPASMTRVDVLINSGIEYPDLRFCDDLIFQALLVFGGVRIETIPEPICYYRKHPQSITTGRNPKNAIPFLRSCQNIWTLSSDHEPTVSDKAYVLAKTASMTLLSQQGKTHKTIGKLYRSLTNK